MSSNLQDYNHKPIRGESPQTIAIENILHWQDNLNDYEGPDSDYESFLLDQLIKIPENMVPYKHHRALKLFRTYDVNYQRKLVQRYLNS